MNRGSSNFATFVCYFRSSRATSAKTAKWAFLKFCFIGAQTVRPIGPIDRGTARMVQSKIPMSSRNPILFLVFR